MPVVRFTSAPVVQVREIPIGSTVTGVLGSLLTFLKDGNALALLGGLTATLINANTGVRLTIPANLAAGTYEVRVRISLTAYTTTTFIIEPPTRAAVIDADDVDEEA